MKINGWYATLGMVGLSCFVVAGCTTTVTSGNPDGATVTGDDSATATGDGAASTDAGSDAAAEAATGDAGACRVAPMTGVATCDTCLETMCCAPLEGCFGTDNNVKTTCQTLVECVQMKQATDAGASMSTMALITACGRDGGTSADDVTNAFDVLNCLGDSDAGGTCATACGN